ncbi:MAG: hypothetical protein F6J98_29670, partial [Moorea sp. SIO4G2]|nr:hypothetical protein [Moorena sp. SIO4G2]
LELEDFTNDLLQTTVEGNLFCKPITSSESELPNTVLYGFGIEHYHLSCHRWNWDFPVLGTQNYTKVQQLINQLYGQEYGEDQLWLKALNGIGISDQDLKMRSHYRKLLQLGMLWPIGQTPSHWFY